MCADNIKKKALTLVSWFRSVTGAPVPEQLQGFTQGAPEKTVSDIKYG